jgi:acyl-CoA thioesterase FadM
MYPFIRMFKEMWKFRNAPALPLLGVHRSSHLCWPWDLDLWNELNNGRTLTLYDLGRLPLARRTGLDKILRKHGWGITVAGNTTRYRRRVQAFDRLDMVSRCIGWDARFVYMEQSMWKGADCTSQMIIRSAIVGKSGIVPPKDLVTAMGHPIESPSLPDWVQAWILAENARPWPPQR